MMTTIATQANAAITATIITAATVIANMRTATEQSSIIVTFGISSGGGSSSSWLCITAVEILISWRWSRHWCSKMGLRAASDATCPASGGSSKPQPQQQTG
ncbi:hypothetical protein E2C01_005965 [Portunus trituberculatus]|uniref:Uncharacterized protein n=1 Tax=Portunus trituberculatus TaxID=210409 RepID=A0A5B7CUY1_PORTR|nr:hypothetical protein [Portunus trituberculatus]